MSLGKVRCPYRFMLSENQQECIRDECMLFIPGGYSMKDYKCTYIGRCGLSNDPDTWVYTHEVEVEQ